MGFVNVSVSPAGSATVNIPGVGSTSNTNRFHGVALNQTITWSASASAGYSLSGPTSGSFVIPNCTLAVGGIQVESTTTTVGSVTVATLPFTGIEAGTMLAAGMMVMAAGGLLLFSVSRKEDRPAAEATFQGWHSA